MKEWFYRKIRESGQEREPEPLRVRLLWGIAILVFIGIVVWRVYYV